MRDSQRSKVYAAEEMLRTMPASPEWLATVGRYRPPIPTVPQLQSYVDLILEQRWFQSRWGQRRIQVRDGRGRRRAGGNSGGWITLPHWARSESVTLHEVAHVLAPGGNHGPTYVGVMVTLVRHVLGPTAARELWLSFREHRVHLSMADVPSARSSRVVTKAMVAKREAERKVAPVHRSTVEGAATVLRRLVAQGHFGPAGRKPRDHALEVARRLEEIVRVGPGVIDQDSLTEVIAPAAKRRS